MNKTQINAKMVVRVKNCCCHLLL